MIGEQAIGKHFQKLHPASIIIYSYVVIILIGTFFLSLPASSSGPPVPLLDALFTATSAVCVTGLATIDIGASLSIFGKWVLILLIELGGLGVMTFSVLFFLFLGLGVGTRRRWIIAETFTPTPVRDVRGLIRSIFFFTFGVQAIGAVLLTLFWRREMETSSAAFAGLFHSVSAFCNCGFAFWSTSFESYRASIFLNVTVVSLIVLGGIGFPVVHELGKRIAGFRHRRRTAYSLHAKMVLAVTLALIVLGAIFVFLLERDHTMAGFTLKERILASLFQSVTPRTAGFNTIPIGRLTEATLFILIMLMFIGASPGSCGGGIKTTSLAVFLAILRSRIRGRHSASMFHRTIPEETVSRTLSVFILAVLVLTICLVGLLITEETGGPGNQSFLAYVFESVSAFGTVGLSMGITPFLTPPGKVIVIVLMLLGRVGLLTVAYVVTSRRVGGTYRYAEEKVMIG